MMKKTARPFSEFTALLLVFLFVVIQFPVPADALEASYADVRILLTDLQKSNILKIQVSGNYSLDQRISFQRGSKLEVYAVDGQLVLHYEAMAYSAGNELKLIRHWAPEGAENGLRLQENYSLYTGDLTISIKDNALYPVLTLPIEEYLQGVVPYEMADDFPIEALKAQAIAARTYTLSNLKPEKAYDLVDNTNDQVYRGLNKDKKNAAQAVRETAGTVCTYGGKLAACLYTASNGGVTESAYNAWGREQIPYLGVQPDPYDAQNPLSIVKKARISKQLQKESNNETALLKDYLEKKLAADLSQRYTSLNEISFEIKEINSIAPHTTKHGGEIGVMRYLRFDVSYEITAPVSGQQDTEVSMTGTENDNEYQVETVLQHNKTTSIQEISLDCPIFPDMEQLLGLSINRNENEIVSIVEDDNQLMIQFTRYGHGVGMSQRGAEWMAKEHRWDYRQILQFYYPGTALKNLASTPRALQPLDVRYITTPGPLPSPSLRPTIMPQSKTPGPEQSLVYVTGVAKDSSLNLRSKPDLLSDIITRLYYGQELLVLKELDDGWLQVQTDVVTGFVRSEYVSASPSQTNP